MEEGIFDTNDNFDFDKLILIKPVVINNNIFFIRYLMNETPLYIQPPKCILKQGFTRAGKRMYCDFIFSNENDDFIRWVENLENNTQRKIYENREKWFETELEMHDIENSFTSPLKIFKSGKYYILRVNVPCVLGVCNLKIYDEDENEIKPDELKENETIMSILEIKGIKCSSRSFQIDIELKQLMILKPKFLFDKCIFKSNNKNNLGNNAIEEEQREKITVDASQITELNKDVIENDDAVLYAVNNNETNDNNITIEKNELEYLLTNDVHQNLEKNEENDLGSNEITLSDPIVENKINNDSDIDNFEEMIQEINFDLDDLPRDDVIQIKNRNDVYFKLYNEALIKARTARDLALSNYLEAKHIKNTYLLKEINNDDDMIFQ